MNENVSSERKSFFKKCSGRKFMYSRSEKQKSILEERKENLKGRKESVSGVKEIGSKSPKEKAPNDNKIYKKNRFFKMVGFLKKCLGRQFMYPRISV